MNTECLPEISNISQSHRLTYTRGVLGMFKAIQYIGTIDDLLISLGCDDDTYPTIISSMIVAGAGWILLIDMVFKTASLLFSAYLVSLVGLVYSLVTLGSLEAQIPGVVIYG